MAAISEIVAQLQTAIDEINEATNAASNAGSGTDDLRNVMAAGEIQDKVAELNQLKDTIEKLSGQLAGSVDIANEAIEQAKAVGT